MKNLLARVFHGSFDRSQRVGDVQLSVAQPKSDMCPVCIEHLEERMFLSTTLAPLNVVYVESNNPDPGQNAILAYHRNPTTGALTPFTAGPFLTHGTGFFNDDERLGPDDSDQEIAVSADRRFLFAVNQGSGTIAVFTILADGRLRLIPGAPYKSGGDQPVSVGIASNNTLVVVNKGDADAGDTTGSKPNYTTFQISANGRLTKIPGSTVEIARGASPSQALISRDGKFVFGDNLFARQFPAPPGFPPFVPPFASELESFKVGTDGKLTRAPGSPFGFPVGPPEPPFMLGLQIHPTRNIVYAGFVVGNKIGVFTYDNNGVLHFVRAIQLRGIATCWLEVSDNGKFMYAANSADDSISVISLANPLNPVELQNIQLNGPKAPLPPPPAAVAFNTTPFQLTLDPTGKTLYVVNHETSPDNSTPQGNQLHVLKVQPDGRLTEDVTSPLIFPQSAVPARAHPQGIVAI